MRAILAAVLALWLSAAAQAQSGIPLMGAGSPGNVATFTPGCSQSSTFLARTSGMSNTYKAAYDTMICGMVTDATWTKFDILYIFATDSQTDALLNLPNATYSATVSGTMTFTVNQGFIGTGVSGFISTGFNPSTAAGNYTQTSSHIGAWTLTTTVQSQAIILADNNPTKTSLYPMFTDSHMYLDINSTTDDPAGIAVTPAQGGYIGTRSGTTLTYYQNGTSKGTRTDTAAAIPNVNLDCYQTSASVSYRVAACWAGGLLTGTDVTNVYNRIHTYMQAIAGAP